VPRVEKPIKKSGGTKKNELAEISFHDHVHSLMARFAAPEPPQRPFL
jgi:hypothetical protein